MHLIRWCWRTPSICIRLLRTPGHGQPGDPSVLPENCRGSNGGPRRTVRLVAAPGTWLHDRDGPDHYPLPGGRPFRSISSLAFCEEDSRFGMALIRQLCPELEIRFIPS